MNTEKLRDYALWYYFKYFPSTKRLLEKVIWKSWGDIELSQKIIQDIAHLIQEEQNIDVRIRFFLQRNKNTSCILQNLLSKGYNKEIVQKLLKEYLEKSEWSLLSRDYLVRKILDYKGKGKSKNYIYSKLVQSSADKKKIFPILEEIFTQGENENIVREYEKLKGKFEHKKIVEKLLRKGFSYEDVRKCISES